MAIAMELHREMPQGAKLSPFEREHRRRLFWTCYLMDRFAVCGSRRPSLIPDNSVSLRIPASTAHPSGTPIDADFFSAQPSMMASDPGLKSPGSTGMLIDIVRVLGLTNQYVAAGGVKGDSHFPWHNLSTLSRIRQELEAWASKTQEGFASVDSYINRPDSTNFVLSKMIYHLIHCLIYRPFIPITLAELNGGGQHQSWQIEATNLCFFHANSIAELIEVSRTSKTAEWPSFMGYCICTAGSVHLHGAHYERNEAEQTFVISTEHLARETRKLADLQAMWGALQYQQDTLQKLYGCHLEVAKRISSNPARYSPALFTLEGFFDRYPGMIFDAAFVNFRDVSSGGSQDTHMLIHDSSDSTLSQSPTRQTPVRISSSKRSSELVSSSPSQYNRSRPPFQRNPSRKGPIMAPSYLASMDTSISSMHSSGATTLTPGMHNLSAANPPSFNFSPVQPVSSSGRPMPPGGHHPGMQQRARSATLPSTSEAYDPLFNFVGNPTNMYANSNINNPNMNHSHVNSSNIHQTPVQREATAPPASVSGTAQNVQSEEHSGNTYTALPPDMNKDPFLTLLEQLAEDESGVGSEHEFDFGSMPMHDNWHGNNAQS
jgi:Fungal specific transcription factor domain